MAGDLVLVSNFTETLPASHLAIIMQPLTISLPILKWES